MKEKIYKILCNVEDGRLCIGDAVVAIMKLIDKRVDKKVEEAIEHEESWSSVERGFK